MNTIQNKINDTFASSLLHHDDSNNETSKPHAVASTKPKLQCQQHFDTLFSTIVLFLEQDPFTNIAMNLDVNFCSQARKFQEKNRW